MTRLPTAFAALAIVLVAGCNSGSETGLGALRVVIQTAGVELDPDGYSIALDGSPAAPVGTNDSVTVDGLDAGAHQVLLTGTSPNCVVTDANPLSVIINRDRTTRIVLLVSCSPTKGALTVVIASTGSDLDPDGYTLSVTGQADATTAASATVSYTALAPGQYAILLTGIQPNCAIQGGPSLSTSVQAGATTVVNLAVVCAALGSGHPFGFVLRRQALAGTPFGIATGSNGVFYASLSGTNQLIRSGAGRSFFEDLVVVGSGPAQVVLDATGGTAYAVLKAGRAVVAVNAATNQVTGSVGLPADGVDLALGAGSGRVYVATAAGSVQVLAVPALTPVATVSIGSVPTGLAMSPDGQTLYVTSRDGGSVVAISTVTNAVTRTYLIGGSPERLAVSPDGSELYVANEAGSVSVITVSNGISATLPFPSGSKPFGISLTPDGTQLYVSLAGTGEVRVLDRAGRTLVKTIAVGGTPRNVAFTADGTFALVTNEAEVVFIR